MKKQIILAAAFAFGAFALSAQVSVVKEAERAMKQKKAPAEVVAIITPAFTNDETKDDAFTYYIPGKSYFNEYDELFLKKQFNKDFPENGDEILARDVLAGYDYYTKALPLDTVVDAKGKVKTKYSKDIVNTIAGRANDFTNAAVALWNAKDYDGSYRAFDIYTTVMTEEPFKAQTKQQPDTVIADVFFNKALAAWQANNLDNALKAFADAKKYNYNKKQLYDYALAVANSTKDEDAVMFWATAGNEAYGSEDSTYLGYIINSYLQKGDFDKAFEIVDQAIAVDPTNSQLYFIKGVLYDNQGKPAEAKAMFKKCIDLNSNNVDGLTMYGRSLYLEGCAINDNIPANTSVADSQKIFDTQIRPLFQEAIDYLEKAYELDPDRTDSLKILANIYYNLGDEAKYNEINNRLNN